MQWQAARAGVARARLDDVEALGGRDSAGNEYAHGCRGNGVLRLGMWPHEGRQGRDVPPQPFGTVFGGRDDALGRREESSESGAPLVYRKRPLRGARVAAALASRLAAAEASVRVCEGIRRADWKIIVQRHVVRASESPRQLEERLRQSVDVMDMDAVDAKRAQQLGHTVPFVGRAKPQRELLAAAQPAQHQERFQVRLEEQDLGVVRERRCQLVHMTPDAAAEGVAHEEDAWQRRAQQPLERRGSLGRQEAPLFFEAEGWRWTLTNVIHRHHQEEWILASSRSRSKASDSA